MMRIYSVSIVKKGLQNTAGEVQLDMEKDAQAGMRWEPVFLGGMGVGEGYGNRFCVCVAPTGGD